MNRYLPVAVVTVLCVGGCVDMNQVESMRAEAAHLRDELRAEAAAWERRVGALAPADPLRPDAEAALAAARAKAEVMNAAVAHADGAIARAKNPDEALTGVATGVAPLLPEPLRTPLLLGAALAASLWRAGQLKRGLASVARGLEKAMEEDTQFRDTFRRHANTFRSIQTGTARRIVDETTGPRGGIRLPI